MLLLCCQPISFNKAVGTDHWFWSGVGWDTSLSAESHFSHSVFFAQLLAGLLLLCHTSEEVNFISSLFIASIKSSCIIFSSKWLKKETMYCNLYRSQCCNMWDLTLWGQGIEMRIIGRIEWKALADWKSSRLCPHTNFLNPFLFPYFLTLYDLSQHKIG